MGAQNTPVIILGVLSSSPLYEGDRGKNHLHCTSSLQHGIQSGDAFDSSAQFIKRDQVVFSPQSDRILSGIQPGPTRENDQDPDPRRPTRTLI